MQKFRLLALLLPISLVLGGCHVPVLDKEITIPFFEKSQKEVFETALKNTAEAKIFKYNSTFNLKIENKNGDLSQLNELLDNQIARILPRKDNTLVGLGSEAKVLGVSESASDSKDYFGFSDKFKNEAFLGYTFKSSGGIDMLLMDNLKGYTKTSFEINNSLSSTLVGFESKVLGNKIYFNITDMPQFISGFLEMFLGTDIVNNWVMIDVNEVKEVDSEKTNDLKDLSMMMPDIEDLKDDKKKLETALREEVEAFRNNSKIFVIEKRERNEKIDNRDNYHYKASLNKEELKKSLIGLIDKYFVEANRLQQEKKKGTTTSEVVIQSGVLDGTIKQEEDKVKSSLNELFSRVDKMEFELWIDKDELYFRKVSYDLKIADLTKDSKLNNSNINAAITGEWNMYDLNVLLSVQAPSESLTFSDILALQKIKSRDLIRIRAAESIQEYADEYLQKETAFPKNMNQITAKNKYIESLLKNIEPVDDCATTSYDITKDSKSFEIKFCLETDGDDGYKKGENILKPLVEMSVYVDADKDGLSDYEEEVVYMTVKNKVDTDKDGYSDKDEIKSGYDPLGKGKIEQFSTPEDTLWYLEREYLKGNLDPYVTKTDYSDNLKKIIETDFRMSIDEFKDVFRELSLENMSKKEIDMISITKKEMSDNENAYLEYKFKYNKNNDEKKDDYDQIYDNDGDDKMYLIKKSDGWYVNLEAEFLHEKQNNKFQWEMMIDLYQDGLMMLKNQSIKKSSKLDIFKI